MKEFLKKTTVSFKNWREKSLNSITFLCKNDRNFQSSEHLIRPFAVIVSLVAFVSRPLRSGRPSAALAVSSLCSYHSLCLVLDVLTEFIQTTRNLWRRTSLLYLTHSLLSSIYIEKAFYLNEGVIQPQRVYLILWVSRGLDSSILSVHASLSSNHIGRVDFLSKYDTFQLNSLILLILSWKWKNFLRKRQCLSRIEEKNLWIQSLFYVKMIGIFSLLSIWSGPFAVIVSLVAFVSRPLRSGRPSAALAVSASYDSLCILRDVLTESIQTTRNLSRRTSLLSSLTTTVINTHWEGVLS